MTTLNEWQNFYVIFGSAAGALIGLQFVVIALIANRPRTQEMAQAGEAFSTPTIVHLTTVLLLAGAMCAPWHGTGLVAVVWGIAGIAGVLYSVFVARSMQRQSAYKPEFEDWLFHALLPIVAYALLIASTVVGLWQQDASLYCVAIPIVLLLVIGIHNAWDSVSYHVFTNNQ
jgi:hypothetical protein